MNLLPTDYEDRKNIPAWDFLIGYFPKAFLEVVKVAVEGNKQHNPGEKLHWARGKSTDQMNTAFRHMLDYGTGNAKDTDGCHHLAKAIWRLSAQLQLDIEAEEMTPVMNNAQVVNAAFDRGLAPTNPPLPHMCPSEMITRLGKLHSCERFAGHEGMHMDHVVEWQGRGSGR